jgi:O-antigen/teichoic acid export membrane protein
MGTMAVNIVLNLILIPSFSAAGAAFTAFCTQMTVALACMVAVEKNMVRLVTFRRLALYILMLLLTFASGRIMRLFGAPWLVAAATELMTGMALALVFRMIEPLKNLKLILERRNSI